MKISLQWLKEFIEITETPEQLGYILTQTGLEVEAIEKVDSIPGGLEGFVLGTVLTCEPFQVKEKTLHLTTVAIGAEQPSQIVCGAANVAAGQRVVVATLGTQLYDSQGKPAFTIEKRKVYGHPSEGMICAEDELGLGQGHDGILVLETSEPDGTSAANYFKLSSDYVFEIGLTPNRADAASHLGVARDISAYTGRPIQLPNSSFSASAQVSPITVEIENTTACPRFIGVYLSNVTVADSPEWLKTRLKAIGLSPINNVVDITNYVNHELGQPMHAYDADTLRGGKIHVKSVAEGTKFTTLDGIERSLKAQDLTISDADGPIGLAGVFGGKDTGISSTTSNVFLEVAYFDPAVIRKTSQNHGLKTDASFRFERGTDPNFKLEAASRALYLLETLAHAKVASGIIDLYPEPILPFVIETTYSRITNLIGVTIPNERIDQILTGLEINVEPNGDALKATVPAYRVDVTRDVDLVEEVLRIYGFDNVPLSEHLGSNFIASFNEVDPFKKQLAVANGLAARGFNEIQTNSLTKESYQNFLPNNAPGEPVVVLNKLSEDLGLMRQSLLFTGLEVLAYNVNRRQKDLRMFEFGKVYYKANQNYKEQYRLGLWLTGNQTAETWQYKAEKESFQSLKNQVEAILQVCKASNVVFTPIESADLWAYGLKVSVNKKQVGSLGLVQTPIAKACELKVPVFFAELDWEYLLKQYKPKAQYKEIAKFPEVRRDLSLVINTEISYSQIQKIAQKSASALLKEMNVFDVYQGSNLGEGKKSYSISFTLQDETQTLTDAQIDGIMKKLIATFEKEIEAIIRT
jgi:phenylalanyl-tRNA synthetase beta chain